MSIRPSSRTFGSLMSDVKRRFGDESGVQLEDADILRWANDGQQQIVTENRVLRSKGDISSVVGQAEYTFPDQHIHSVASIHYDGVPLRNLSFQEAEQYLLGSDPKRESSGTPVLWYFWENTFYLWPKPDEPKDVSVFFSRYPNQLTGDPAQILDISDKYYPALANYVLQQCYEMDEDWEASQAKEAQFKTALAEQREEDFMASDDFYPTITEVI